MTVLLHNDAVFFHIPKTGGSWVYHILEEFKLVKARLGHEHAHFDRAQWHDRYFKDARVLRQIVRRAIGSYRAPTLMPQKGFKFCFVREPLKWYESYWRFMQDQDWKPWGDETDAFKWHPNAMLNGLGSPDFNTFMANVNKKRPGYVTEMYGWYVRPGVEFIGKQENLAQDLIKAFSLMNLNIDPKRVLSVARLNESPSHIPKPEWDPALREETLRYEYAGYARYGYPVDKALLAVS
jgi:hypothetical protein